MSDFERYQKQISDAQYIAEINEVIQPLARSPAQWDLARQLITDLIGRDFSSLRGSADEWYNLVTYAARCGHITAEERILEVALEANPDDVDLLCTLFQHSFVHGSLADANNVFRRIQELGEPKTAPYWRYWAYTSTFLARYLKDRKKAIDFLERAKKYVVPADLLNIFRSYRTVLIDGAINPSDASESEFTDYANLVARVVANYEEGLALGIEDGYVLATQYARLLRESCSGKEAEEADAVLDKALALLDIAERTYTHDANHPVYDIYLEKAITLMARRRYADALQIFRSLPDHLLDESIRVMTRYAANMTGQTLEGEIRPSTVLPSTVESDMTSRLDMLESTVARIVEAITRARADGDET